MRLAILCSLALPALAACASAQLSSDHLATLQAAISSADAVGASKVPTAALHLKLAQEELEEAKRLVKTDADRADLVLQRSAADADLALALTRAETAQAEAKKAHNAVLAIEGKQQ